MPTAAQRASGFTNFADLITLQSGTVGADVLGRTFPRGTVFDPATTRQLQAGQVDPVTGLVATQTGFVRDAFPGNQIPGEPYRRERASADAALPRAEPGRIEQQLRREPDNNDDTHAFDIRVDHNFSGNDRFFARYSFSDNHKVRPPPFEGDADGGGFSEGDEKVRVHGFAASHTHMFSNSADQRGALRRQPGAHQPAAAERRRHQQPAGSLRHSRRAAAGGQWRSAAALRPAGLSQLGHDGWVVSERFSNTAQFSDNLTKLYKSHTFKGGYMYQDIFFGSTQPPYARGEYYWDGRYTSLVNQTDNTTARAQFLLSQIPSMVPGGVDFLGGMHDIRVSPFGDVDAFKTYHGAYAQDSWRVSHKLTVNYGVRWDYFSREQEREAEQANMVPGPPARYLIPAEWRRQAAVAELRQ